MTKSLINFSAGPSKIPDEVKQIMLKEFLDYKGTGSNIFELSHRSEYFTKIVNNAKCTLKHLYSIPDSYEILFMQGGATGQFAAIPLNLLKHVPTGEELSHRGPDYFVTGQWSAKAAKEAKTLLGSSKGATNVVNLITPIDNTGLKGVLDNFIATSAPAVSAEGATGNEEEILTRYLVSKINPEATYFYYCSNETIEGFEMNDDFEGPDVRNNFLDVLDRAYRIKWEEKQKLLLDGSDPENFGKQHARNGHNDASFKMPIIVCDMSSNMCTKPIDITRFGLIYAGAQKNIGIAGITVVIVRKDLISMDLTTGPIERPIPSVMNYAVVSKAGSLPNTPPVYSIYALDHTLTWILKTGLKATTTTPMGHPVDSNGIDKFSPALLNGDGFCHATELNGFSTTHHSGALTYWSDISRTKVELIHRVIDKSRGFYTLLCQELNFPLQTAFDTTANNNTRKDDYYYLRYRSRINISFKINTPVAVTANLENEFLELAKKEENMHYLKGHRSVGGIRASLFNSISLSETRRLANFMENFWKAKMDKNL